MRIAGGTPNGSLAVRLAAISRSFTMKHDSLPLRIFALAAVCLAASLLTVSAQEPATYQVPPASIRAIAEAAPTPRVLVDPTRELLLVIGSPAMPSIAELSEPEYRLAGIRLNPATNARSRRRTGDSLTLVRIDDGSEKPITGLPASARIDDAHFSPDGATVAFSNTTDDSVDLWVADVATGEARRLLEGLNGVYWGSPFAWLSDSDTLVAKVVPAGRGDAPSLSNVPTGPVIQETTGDSAPARTYQDLLASPHDAALFAHYLQAQIVTISLDGLRADLGSPDPISRVEPSPDGKLFLVETLEKPFSFLVPAYRFPHRVEVLGTNGRVVQEVARLPLAENVPIGRNAVPTGPRSFGWRADADATVWWVEAQDGGDPSREAELRDKLYTWDAPFTSEPSELASLPYRFRDVYWGDDGRAIVREWWWQSRQERLTLVAPASPEEPAKELFAYSYEDRYHAPGIPLMSSTPRGTEVLLMDRGRIFLTAEGASPEGNRPFVDALDLRTLDSERRFHSESPYYEYPVVWLDPAKGLLLTRRESQTEPPNYFAHDVDTHEARALTQFPDPYPQLAGVTRELIRYQRDDGVQLTATLYLPAGYQPSDGRLPLLVWAYPREYKSAAAAAQVRDSPHRFSRVNWGSPLYWLTRGYAVMEGATMPIVGEGDAEPNDTYVQQLVASAQAAVDEAVRRGVADPDRVGIGGHSYGAFMTANLLAHSDIFRAGIARSGAYNRSLTPFGFQSEQRTFWQAPEIYFAMSPFMHADHVNEPILLIHGEADNNSGTFPIQSRRFFAALKGHGATARLVMLPNESHGYSASESVLHTLWEMDEWLERYVKKAPPREKTSN